MSMLILLGGTLMKTEISLEIVRQSFIQLVHYDRAFHILSAVRRKYNFDQTIYQLSGNVIFANVEAVREFCDKVNQNREQRESWLVSEVNAMALIDEINHYIVRLYVEQYDRDMWNNVAQLVDKYYGEFKRHELIETFGTYFEPISVYLGKCTLQEYLNDSSFSENRRHVQMEEIWMLYLINSNPACVPYKELYDDENVDNKSIYLLYIKTLRRYLSGDNTFGPEGESLFDLLEKPFKLFPNSLKKQLEYMQRYWTKHFQLEKIFSNKILRSFLLINEVERYHFVDYPVGVHGDEHKNVYSRSVYDPQAFSTDCDWMPNVVMIAKNALVWLHQLSKQYGYLLKHLDHIPNDELIRLAKSGINTLWLIGIWRRSHASKKIKRSTGNNHSLASAYSLDDNTIAEDLGGWPAFIQLRDRASQFGIRLAGDMIPNHTGIDSRWVVEHPEYFLTRKDLPYNYSFTRENVTDKEGLAVYVEDGYYRRSDAAVVFKRVDTHSGDVRYIYHGNDGTMMPWNDTAQIDFLNPTAREAVIQEIINMSYNFSVIRLDAAMVLVKKHIQRLWYPSSCDAEDFIPSRGEYAMTDEDFDKIMPMEFWREVVDRVTKECPQTLLIAEAFWMLEGYFVRSLGMHRVYNSAFMHMLSLEKNREYRDFIKKTIQFDLGILKRFVNFMSNPDEKTAIEQFGSEDKYFGVATLMVTLPGLPMFAHGQLEGFREKYGMEYAYAQEDEQPDTHLWLRHEQDIFPLLHRRFLFSESCNFRFYDCVHDGHIQEHIFSYTNKYKNDFTLVVYNNSMIEACGNIHGSSEYKDTNQKLVKECLADALGLQYRDNYYTVFQEQRSNLWYIRNNVDIFSQGIFVSLSGYQSQVFWNFQQVYDANKHYEVLYIKLGLSGSLYDLTRIQPESFLLEKPLQLLSVDSVKWVYDACENFYHKHNKKINNKTKNHPYDLKLLRSISSIFSTKKEIDETFWNNLIIEYDYMLIFPKLLTIPAKKFYLKDRRYLYFIHYYFFVKKIHELGMNFNHIKDKIIMHTLHMLWWPKINTLEFLMMHQLAILLIKHSTNTIVDNNSLNIWWKSVLRDSEFMQSVGVNSYGGVLYFHDESLFLALDLVLSVCYFEKKMVQSLYQSVSHLNILQQGKRWQKTRKMSMFLYEDFSRLLVR